VTLSVRTLLFTDIEGSTSLLDRAGPEYSALLAIHRRIMRASVEHAGGIEHGTEGDSFFITFDSPTAALAAAVESQLAIETHEWPYGLRLRVRMGLRLGAVQHDGDDTIGMPIHHAPLLELVVDRELSLGGELEDDRRDVRLGHASNTSRQLRAHRRRG
jgi:class 3 adenylate cyclase